MKQDDRIMWKDQVFIVVRFYDKEEKVMVNHKEAFTDPGDILVRTEDGKSEGLIPERVIWEYDTDNGQYVIPDMLDDSINVLQNFPGKNNIIDMQREASFLKDNGYILEYAFNNNGALTFVMVRNQDEERIRI